MIDFGIVKPGSTLYIPFGSYAGSTGAPSAMTNLATSDILVYKDGSVTERASASGFTLLDTDGLDFDGKTGINGVSIDLSDNTTAGFWAAGARYWVVIGDVTVDSQTVRFIAATFTIGLPEATLNTTVATLSSQTSFTLTAGPAEDDALNGCVIYFHDVASSVQGGFAVVLDYTGSTKTVTLAAGTTYTVATTDNVCVCRPVAVTAINGVLATSVTTINANLGTTAPVNFTGSGGTAYVKSDMVDVAGAAVSTSTAQIGVNAVNVGGTAQTGRDLGASVLLSTGTGTGQLDFTSGVVKANVTQFNGSNATAASGRPEVNTSHIAGSAVSTSTAQIGVNAVNINGTAIAGPGSVPELGIVDRGTAQSVTGTTIVLRSAAAFADDELNGAVVYIPSATLGAGQARFITDYVGSTDTATVDAWTTTPTGTITYIIFAAPPNSVTSPIPANVTQIAGAAVSTSTAQLGVNVVQAGATAWASGAITAASIATDAITAAKIAADAIGASELAADAVTEIQLGLASSSDLSTVSSDILTAISDLDVDVTAVKAKTDNLPAAPAAVADIAAALTATIADSVPADGTRPSVAQGIYMLVQRMMECSVTGTTMTIKKPDGSTTLLTLTLNDGTTPTSVTRAT